MTELELQLQEEVNRLNAQLDGEGTRLMQCRAQVDSLKLTVADLKAYESRLAEIDSIFGCDHVSRGPDDAAEVVRHVRELKSQVESLEKQCGTMLTCLENIYGCEGPIPKLHPERLKEIRSILDATTAGRDYFKVCPKCHYEVGKWGIRAPTEEKK